MLQIAQTANEALKNLAEYFIKIGREAIASHHKFSVALSGGSSPKGLFELLSSQYKTELEWNKVFFFWGDERYVPADNPDSNALMAKKSLLNPLDISADHIFTVNTTLDPNAAAADYQEKVEKFFGNSEKKFDLILLGLGDNSHTASLFPHTDVIAAKEVGVKSVFLQDQQVYRITFTAPLINLAHHIAFLVLGAGKSEAVQHVLEGEKNVDEYPAQLIQLVAGELVWFMDEEAAKLVKNKID